MLVLVERISIASELGAGREVERRLLEELARHGYSGAAVFAVKLALQEGLNNAIVHGGGSDPTKRVEVCYDVDKRRVCVTITDEGGGFAPEAVPDPTADENLQKPSGRGLMLMRAYMDGVQFNERGNQVRMIKRNR
ncbi:MAG: ATP-binding protein [Phycisphaerae bacterium]|nr:ATP-binding protein [Phycisphaerae bacterium]